MLKVLICSYQDADTIQKTLESVRQYQVHLFDGRFNDFPGESWSSTDGTLEIAAKFPNVKIHQAVPNETQCEKRTRMFSVIKDGEYGLKLDGDERLLNPISEKLKADVIWAWTISPLYDYPYVTARIFKKHDGMHYAGKHHYLFDRKHKLIASDQNMGLYYTHDTLSFRVFNARGRRNSAREVAKTRFLQQRSERKVKTEHDPYGVQRMKKHPDRAQITRKSMDVLQVPDKPQFTYSLIFSRPWAIDRYFDNLSRLQLPDNTEVICVVDTDDKKFYAQVQKRLVERQWNGVLTYMTGDPAPQEKRYVNQRRLRIARNLHIVLTEARGEILLGSEDDSLPQADAYLKLIRHLDQSDFAQATIVGRWEPTIPAWHTQELKGQLYKIWTGEKREGVEAVQGMGWYCFAAKMDVMRSVKIHWDTCQHIGPDFHMGYDLHKAGYKLLHDHDIQCVHFGQDWERTLEHQTVTKHWIKQGKVWSAY